MQSREIFRNVGLAVAVLGLAAGLIATVEACGESQDRGAETGASTFGQLAGRPKLPSLDLEAPVDFQTASFALG